MVGPTYAVTEKGGHLDANGYRWMGMQFGKAMHRVLTLGQDYFPLHPLRATLDGRRLHVRLRVPVPPLAKGQPFVGQTRFAPQDGGFAVLDGAGPVPLANIDVGPDSVELTLAREAEGAVALRYADGTRHGRGGLLDSDAEQAPDSYVYDAATGHFETADHPDLNGRPYRLQNWCAAFAIPVQVQPVAAPVAPASAPAASPVPAGQSRGAWDTLRTTRTEVTGAALPPRRGWLARLLRALLGHGGG